MARGNVQKQLFWSDFEQQLGACHMTLARSSSFNDSHAHTHSAYLQALPPDPAPCAVSSDVPRQLLLLAKLLQ